MKFLWYVSFYKVQRFGELMRRLGGTTQSTLTKQLRELESDGFLHREIYSKIPPKAPIGFKNPATSPAKRMRPTP